MSKRSFATVLGVVALILIAARAQATSTSAVLVVKTSVPGGGDWNDPNTWMPPGKPTENDDVVIESKVTKSGTNPPEDCKSLTVKSNGELTGKNPGEPLEVRVKNEIVNLGRISTPDNPDPAGNGGDIKLTTSDGSITNQGTIQGGRGGDGSSTDPAKRNGGNGGSIVLDASGVNRTVTNTSTVAPGHGGDGASTSGANNPPGDGGKGGGVTAEGKGGVVNGPGGGINTGNGGQGGNADGTGVDAGKGGDAGGALLGSEDKIDNDGTIVTGNGGKGGDASDPQKKNGPGGRGGDIKGGKYVSGGGKDVGGKTARARLPGNEQNGFNGANGSGAGGQPTGKIKPPEIKIAAHVEISLYPSSTLIAGTCTLDAGEGDLILSGLQAGAIDASDSIELFGLGAIDLTGIPAGVDVLVAANRVRVTAMSPAAVALDAGVSLASISSPDAGFLQVVWHDGVELYVTGSMLDGQGGWSGWDNGPDFDTVATPSQARGGLQSLEVKLASDLVQRHLGLDTGRFVYRTFVYTSSEPPDELTDPAWLRLLSSYDVPVTPSNTSVAVQVELDGSSGTWRVDAGSPSTASGPLATDTWVELRAEIDLDLDTVEVFYDGESMAPAYAWSGGALGGGSDPREIAAASFRATTSSATSVAYWDDLSLAWSGPPTISSYCTAKVNSKGCTPAIGWTGAPSASAGAGFAVVATDVINNKSGLYFYSLAGQKAVAFQGGHLCVKLPLKRTQVQSSGGNPPPNDCSGHYAFEFNAYIASGADPALVAGVPVDGQYWARDPGFAPPFNTSFTDGIHFVIGP